MLTKKDFKAIASVLAFLKPSKSKTFLAQSLACYFAQVNLRFNYKKFFEACGEVEKNKGAKTLLP